MKLLPISILTKLEDFLYEILLVHIPNYIVTLIISYDFSLYLGGKINNMIETIITIIKTIWLVPFLILIIWYFKKPSTKGKVGEFVTNSVIKISFDKDKYHLVKDLTFKTHHSSTQVDEVIISQYGIFVIETKNWNGWIFGSEHQAEWTVVYKGGKKYKKLNPILQNKGHIKAIAEKFNIPESKIFSIVVFVGDVDKCKIKTKMPDNVGYPSTMRKYIESKSEILLSKINVEKILKDIAIKRLPRGRETDIQHIENIRKMHR